MPREVSQERLLKDTKRVLEHPLWISEIEPGKPYTRTHDDHDGSGKGKITVFFSPDADAWIDIQPSHTDGPLRFRTGSFGGGGMSQRVRNALIVLAYAIKLDNEEKPQKNTTDPA